MADSISQVLSERGKRYGVFSEHAKYAQEMKEIFRTSHNWKGMQPDQREALEMIAHKIWRILNGDPDYFDSWKDIAGYAKLVSDRLETGIEDESWN